MPNRGLQQDIALRQLKQRLQQEQLAFDPGDTQHDDYQAQLDAVQEKETALADAREAARRRRV